MLFKVVGNAGLTDISISSSNCFQELMEFGVILVRWNFFFIFARAGSLNADNIALPLALQWRGKEPVAETVTQLLPAFNMIQKDGFGAFQNSQVHGLARSLRQLYQAWDERCPQAHSARNGQA